MTPDPIPPTGHPAPAGLPALLRADEPEPVFVLAPDGRSPFLLACDHAGRRLPARLGQLGLPVSEFDRHIAWDIGIEAVSRRVSDALDCTLIGQRYSRLVIDCNRPPDSDSSIPTISESTVIPDNVGLDPAEREERVATIFRPYHDRLAAAIDAREAAGRRTVLIAMHSFTPAYKAEHRPWHIGTLYGRDGRLARAFRDALLAEPDLVVGDNEPYSVSDASDHTIPVHGERRGLLHVGLEIRQDLIGHESGQAEWAERLVRVLPRALAALDATAEPIGLGGVARRT